MTTNTPIPELDKNRRDRINRIMKSHFGFVPKDQDVDSIDAILRNHYLVLHDEMVIRHLVARKLTEFLEEYRGELGSLELERLLLDRSMFTYLRYASMCYRAGVPAGTISLCRTAIEVGLREKLAEMMAKEQVGGEPDPMSIKSQYEKLSNLPISRLLSELDRRGTLGSKHIEHAFKPVKLGDQNARSVLDKVIHGDIAWIVELAESMGKDTTVIGVDDPFKQLKVAADAQLSVLAVAVLFAAYRIAEQVYLYPLREKTA